MDEKKRKKKLTEEDEEMGYGAFSQAEDSAAEQAESEAEQTALVSDLTTRHKKRQKELSKLKSPQDDVTGEIKSAKKKSKKKLEDTAALSMAETDTQPLEAMEEPPDTVTMETAAALESLAASETLPPMTTTLETEDGTIPMPPEESTLTPTPSQEPPTPKTPEAPTPRVEAEEEKEAAPLSDRPRTLTLKERMKSRLAKAKEEAKTEIQEEARQERKKLRDLRDQQKATRFDTEEDFEEMERMNEERTRSLRQRWSKKTFGAEKGFLPSAEEAYDFFTRIWEPETEVPPETPKEEEKKEEEEKEEKPEGEEEEPKPEGEEETTDDKAPLLDEIPYDEEGYGPVAMRKPEMPDLDKILKEEEKLLFYPSSAVRPMSQKIEEAHEPRFLEEEGFYVGTRPVVKEGNRNRMEDRLLHEYDKGRGWFGEDGQMIVQPDPLKKFSTRPFIPEEPEPALETVWKRAVMRDFDSRYIDGVPEGFGNYQLDVDLNSISFSHHHLFSQEHVLANRLAELYSQYVIRRRKDMANFLTEKLHTLKSSKVNLQDHIMSHKGEMSVADRGHYEQRLQDYKFEIRQTRVLRDNEVKADRTLIRNIIHTWKLLKQQRTDQGFTNTPVKVVITKEVCDKEDDLAVMRMEQEAELDEAREEHEERHRQQLVVYKNEHDKWKQQKERRAQAAGEEGQAPEQEEEEEPQPPEDFSESETRAKIVERYNAIHRKPGEPILTVEMTNSATVTPNTGCSRQEQARRDAVSSCKLYVKVLFNNKEVCRSPAKPLSQDFKVNFGDIYNLKIVQWPESIKFQVFEGSGMFSNLLAELYAPIPESSVTSLNVQIEDVMFSVDQQIAVDNGVGSGVPFSFGKTADNKVVLLTTGILRCSVAWAVDDDGNPLIPPSPQSSDAAYNMMSAVDPVSAIGAAGVVNVDKLAKWFKEARLDPNDPANADLVYLLGMRSSDDSKTQDFFRLEQLQEEFNFIEDEDFEANKRNRVLILRDEEVAEFRNMKLVPAFDRELPRDVFTEYERKLREEERLRESEDAEAHRAAVHKFLQHVREQVIRRYRLAQHHKRLEDMVIEEEVPNIAMIGLSLLRITEPRRPLKPIRKERKKVTATAIKGDEVRIMVNIIRCSYVPLRKPTLSQTAKEGGDKATTKIMGETSVRPYVEVLFQRNTVKTSVGEGPNPSFNEELELPLKAPNDDFSPNNLQTINDTIFLNLFDEVVVDVLQDDRERDSNVHQRLEKKWLGSLRIPFSTVYLNNKIDGTFRFSTPPVLLGYTYDLGGGGDSNIESSIGRGEGNTYISMFITIEPPLVTPEPMRERIATNEDEKLLQLAETWCKELFTKFPKRSYKCTVTDVNGKAVFITRFFKPLKPPEDITSKGLDSMKTADFVARFVALIPFVPDTVVFPGLCDIWSTCDQFLKMLAGDEEEHAVLLTNYFLGLGIKAWLILGDAVPEGPTAYVLSEHEREYFLWNSSTGERYSTKDSYCPLQSVSCAVNHENIWGNVYQYSKPAQMDFNVHSSTHWKPFFGRTFPSPGLASIQPEALVYQPADANYALELQEKIETMLKNKIMEWRARYITRWNRHGTQIMRKLLPLLEENCGKSIEHAALGELESSFSSYKVSGFPMNMPFVDLNSIVESVFATGVHTQETSNVEFALAVYVHPYVNAVLSVWIYVASMIRLR